MKPDKIVQNPIKEILPKKYILRLYIVGKTPNCIAAIHNLKNICEEYLPENYHIEIIDLLQFPQLAKDDQILAIPTVIRKLPKPVRKLIGDLSDKDAVLIGLDLHPTS
ncbi:MAG: circadian clock protein KaiB [Gammaproteobacteria bacterium]|nr:circadian clock protein KaiB [Gammaproteobacteria bacterium]